MDTVLALGHSRWSRSWQLTGLIPSLDTAKVAIQYPFPSHDPPWPSSFRVTPDQYCPLSRSRFRDPPWPISLRWECYTANGKILCFGYTWSKYDKNIIQKVLRNTQKRFVYAYNYWLWWTFLLLKMYTNSKQYCHLLLVELRVICEDLRRWHLDTVILYSVPENRKALQWSPGLTDDQTRGSVGI